MAWVATINDRAAVTRALAAVDEVRAKTAAFDKAWRGARTGFLVAAATRSASRPPGLRGGALACKTRKSAHLVRCRLLHGSACLPKRERAPDRDPFDVAV